MSGIYHSLARNPMPIIRPAGGASELPGPGCAVNDTALQVLQVLGLDMYMCPRGVARSREQNSLHAEFRQNVQTHLPLLRIMIQLSVI